jgi:hypothetical protein
MEQGKQVCDFQEAFACAHGHTKWLDCEFIYTYDGSAWGGHSRISAGGWFTAEPRPRAFDIDLWHFPADGNKSCNRCGRTGFQTRAVEIGRVYHRRCDIHVRFSGQQQGS